jgi:hypothetical protein
MVSSKLVFAAMSMALSAKSGYELDGLFQFIADKIFSFSSHVHTGCETWPLTLREEHKLRVFESRLLRRLFGPKRDGMTGGWRKVHNEELHDVYSSPSIIKIIKSRRMRWAGHVARIWETRNAFRGRETTRKTKTWVDG